MLIELLVILFQFFRLSRTLKLRPKTVVAYRRETAEYRTKKGLYAMWRPFQQRHPPLHNTGNQLGDQYK